MPNSPNCSRITRAGRRETALFALLYLINANLHEANLNGTNLEGAALDGADLRDARYDTATTFPRPDFKPEAQGAYWTCPRGKGPGSNDPSLVRPWVV